MSSSAMGRAARFPLLGAFVALAFPLVPGRLAAGDEKDTAFAPRTRVTLRKGFWEINDKPTYPGSAAEGLLLNVRMVHAVFEDRNASTCPKGFDPDTNTAAFIERIPEYLAHGVLAFTINLQGGAPGYEGALNSAFDPDGALRPGYMARVARVIEACDRAGAVVFLGCFSPAQDQVLRDRAAVEKGVQSVLAWLAQRGYRNVILEVADAHTDAGYDHAVLKDPNSLAALVRTARQQAPDLLVSASGAPGGRSHPAVATAANFIFLHFQQVAVDDIFDRVAAASKLVKAIVCNDDPRTGEEGAKAAAAAVDALCSWGFANREVNEAYPFKFKGAADDPVVYAKLRELTRG